MGTRIARMWRGRTRAEDAEAFTAYLEATGVRELRDTPGSERVLVLRRLDGDIAEFWVNLGACGRNTSIERAGSGPRRCRAAFGSRLDPAQRIQLQALSR